MVMGCLGFATTSLSYDKKISQTVYELMLSKIPQRKSDMFCWPLTRAGAKKRVAFCEEQAALLNKKPAKSKKVAKKKSTTARST